YIILKNKSGIDDLRVPLGKAFPGADMYLLIPAGLGVCFIGSVLTNYFAAWADSNGFGFNSYYEALNDPGAPDGVAGVIILILHSAVVPAIVEELAFRGVVMQTLRKFGDVFAIVSSAVLFGLIHANMTQVPFAIVAGIALGYCATVTGTLRTSITVHFLNNFVSVMVTLISRYFGDTPATVFSSVAMYGFIIIGLIAFAVYALRHPYLTRLRPGRFGAVQKKAACFFLAPVMAAAILWVAWYIILDVSPVYDFFNPV
ncbi:MAG: CPBP family intramembrane metalloprotease, partial [Clostridia bacterium]|nr:CPBP family intramembrane metalloprotease [Clostridia bacterium]